MYQMSQYVRTLVLILLLASCTHSNATLRAWQDLIEAIREKVKTGESLSILDFGPYLAALKIPQAVVPIFKNLRIKTPTFAQTVAGFKRGVTVKGSVLFNTSEVAIEVIVVDLESAIEPLSENDFVELMPDESTPQDESLEQATPTPELTEQPATAPTSAQEPPSPIGVSVMISSPGGKLSDTFPDLHAFDTINLPQGTFILSTFAYKHPLTGIKMVRGLNFTAAVDLVGPFAQLQRLIDKLATYLVVEAVGTAYFQAVFSPDIRDSRFMVILPTRLGVDFMELYHAKVINQPPEFLSRITTADFIAHINPFDLSLLIDAGVILNFVTQPEPVEFRCAVQFDPTEVQMVGKMIGVYEHAFGIQWLHFGDANIKLGVNFVLAPTLMASTGQPFNMVGFGGMLALGAAAKKAAVKVDTVVGFSEKAPPSIVFKGGARNISFTEFVDFFADLIHRQYLLDAIPTIELSDLDLVIVPVTTRVAGTKYDQGFKGRAAVQLGLFKGALEFGIDPTHSKEKLLVRGIMADLVTPFISITGPESSEFIRYGITKGPAVNFYISPTDLRLFMASTLEIPLLKIKRSTQFSFDKNGLRTFFEMRLFDNSVSGMIDLNIPFTSLKELYMAIELKQVGAHDVKDLVLQKLRVIRDQQLKDLDRINKEIADVQNKIEELKQDIRQQITNNKAGISQRILRKKERLMQFQKVMREQARRCKFLSPKTWFGECAHAAWAAAHSGLDAAHIEMLEVSKLLGQLESNVAGDFYIALQRLDKALLELHAASKKISYAGLQLLSVIVDAATALEVHVKASLTGSDLQKVGVMPQFTALCSFKFAGKQTTYSIGNLDFSSAQNTQNSLQVVTQELYQDIEQTAVEQANSQAEQVQEAAAAPAA